MATFVYTAKRSLMPGRIVDQQYQLEIETQSSPRSRRVEKTDVRARGGATETLYHRADREWNITFEPVQGAQLDALIEFLNSTESGEPFDMQIFSSESTFTTVKRIDDGYELDEYMPTGAERSDWYVARMSVRAV